MMYMFLICYNPAIGLAPDDPPTLQPQHAALGEQLLSEGRFVSGGALVPYESAKITRVQGKTRLSIDGPYAEAKEVVGGYYVVECKDAADAEAVGMRIPVASNAWVQVRPLLLHNKG
jgi:hypothetical protein